jgi:hypothetical protein
MMSTDPQQPYESPNVEELGDGDQPVATTPGLISTPPS